MASSLFLLLDDIATLLDDVSVMTKVAAKKTAGVLGDDLALNAQQVSGVKADRELPVVWAVAKGSFVNKLILVPLALLISAFLPWLIKPLLMVGGAFLCYEGVEKLAHKFLHSKSEEEAHHAEMVEAVANPAVDLVAYEKDKIKGAIRTDFILSAEIIVISLGTVAAAALPQRIAVLSAIAIVMTVGVYGLVAGIVKLDDVGLWLSQKAGATARAFGRFLLWGTPWLMRALSVLGTLAMFLVGGGIIAHGIAPLAHWLHEIELSWSGLFSSVTAMLVNLGIGLLVGAVVLAVVTLIQRMRKPADGGLRA
ncbi:DUF808 domain-containing protein [Brachymonas denitrificans]|uniref:DUF808 domain-containing protein n=1 Tax=Brachymonas denitrificans TaxID=28220 RepID=UPI002AFE2303|nr:DUF808 domain-containing protein [Brachymonas denitrificans]